MEHTIFLQLSLVFAVAAGISVLVRLFRQPLIIGYILTGILCGPSFLNIIHNHAAFDSFSQIGITLLLFIVGLGLNIATVRSTGKAVFVVFFANVVVIGGLAFGLGKLLGFTVNESVIVGLGILFSSTIVIIKALTDKKEQNRLYGQITIAVTLLEDIMATFALLYVTAASGGATWNDVGVLVLKGAGLAALLVMVGGYIMPRIVGYMAKSQELLFTFTLAWGFGIATLFQYAGFSIEVGALFAGVTLASLPYAKEIGTRLKPLRDFFLVLFFISLGEGLRTADIRSSIGPALLFALLTLSIKPMVISSSLGFLGFTKQTGFKASIYLSQISEFSIILAVLAHTTGLVSSHVVSVITLTAMITIAVSSVLMNYDDKLYLKLQNVLSMYERPNARSERTKSETYKLVLFGYRKGGYEFVKTFREMRKRYVVIDYDPDVIEHLERQHIHHIYGDATDYELLQEIGVHNADMVVSTIPDYATNAILVRHVMQWNSDGIFICHANDLDDAAKLYEHGAAYVILPHFIGNEQINSFIRKNGNNLQAFQQYRSRHILALGKAAVR